MEGEDWPNYVKDTGSDKCYKSFPNNPDCFFIREGCSKAMATPNLCFWHSVRMASVKECKCGCNKSWKTLDGDAIGRALRREYSVNNGPYTIIDSSGRYYCCSRCQNTDNYEWTCGSMYICPECSELHDKKVRIEEDKKEREPWHLLAAYSRAVSALQKSGQYFQYGIIKSDGPSFIVSHPTEGSFTVKNASTALIAAGISKRVIERDWWLWIAGWYEDSPEILKQT